MQGINIHEGRRHSCRAQIYMQARHLDSILIDTFLKRESDSGNPMPNTFVERDPSHFSDSNTHLVWIFQFHVSTMSMTAMTARQGSGVELKDHQKSCHTLK